MIAVHGLIYALSAVAIALTLLPLWTTPRWWVRLWDYPRLQLGVVLAALLVLQIVFLRSSHGLLLMLATAGCLGWQLFNIASYTPLWRRQVQSTALTDEASAISILVSNVLQDNRNSALLLERVANADPDIVLLVETDRWWDEQISVLAETYPYAVRHPLENTYGIHLFSRLELTDIKVRNRVKDDIPSIDAQVRLRSGDRIWLYCVHPEPPQVGNDVDERDAELLLVAREVAGHRKPSIVCGDLNDVAWSHTTRLFQRISGLLDPRIGRGLYPTFHAWHWWARWPLDHVFHDASFKLVRLAVLPYYGSDHFPIFVHLLHDPAAAHEQEAPKADESDLEEAAERIADV